MKILLSLFALAGFLASGSYACAAGVSGTWKGAFDFQGSSIPLVFHLNETGDTLAGSIEGLPTTPVEIHDGHVAGDQLTFWTDTDYEGQTYKVVFTGHLSSSANQISFNLATEDGSWSSELVAQKSDQAEAGQQAPAVNVTGTWKGSFDFEGNQVPVTMNLEDAGDTVTGTVTGLLQEAPQKPINIQDGKLQGDKLTFWLNVDYQGQTYKVVYNGTVSEGKIQFTFGTDDGSWSTNMTVTKAAS